MKIKLNLQLLSIFILLVVFGLKIYIIFWQINLNHLLVPPSPDLIAHVKMADALSSGASLFSGGYPPLLHLIVSKLSTLFHTTNLNIFTTIAPYWLIVVIPIFYLLVYKLFGWKTAFWATAIYILVSTSPFLNFIDAQYADILGYNIFGPFYLLFFISAINQKKYWYFLVAFIFFLLMLLAHHLSSVLLYFVSLVSLIIYTVNNYFNNKSEFKRSAIILLFFLGISFILIIIARIVFPSIISLLANSTFHLQAGIKDSTSKVLEYSNFSTLLSPFLEFLGFAGLLLMIALINGANSKNSFTKFFFITWIIVCLVLSRSSIFVLPQRIFREIALPLYVLAGYFITIVISQTKNNFVKILILGLSGYLIVINSIQLFYPPSLLPDGFKNMSWYHQVDQEKFDWMTYNIPSGSLILANCSNPVLLYKLEKEGYKIIYFSEKGDNLSSDQQKKDYVDNYIKNVDADYLLIGVMPPETNPETYFVQFANYTKATDLLNKSSYRNKNIEMSFSDGSELIKLKNNDQE